VFLKNGHKSKKHKSKVIFPPEIMELVGIVIKEHSQPKGIKLQMRGHELRTSIY
jgi:hypothetical protein